MPGQSALQKRTPGGASNRERTLTKLRRLHALAASVKPVGNRVIPVMTSGAPTLAWTNTGTPSTVGLGTQWQYAAGKVTVFGGTPRFASPGYYFDSRWVTAAGGATKGPDYWTMEAMTEDTAIGVFVSGAVTNGIRIQVDGQLVSATPTTTGTSSYNVLKIDFAGVRALRRITLEAWGGGWQFIGFLTTPTGVVYPTNPDPFKLMVLGDSVVDGTGCTWNGDGFPRHVANQLGVSNLVVSGDGGTGFVSVTGTGKQNFQTRTADVIAQTPDLLITAMSSNDYSQTPAATAAGVAAYLDTIRAALPTLPIILFGTMWHDASLTTAQANETAVQAMVNARTDPFLKFVNTKVVSAGNTAPIWGLGNTTSPTGSGSADWAFDGTAIHPNTEGSLFIGRFIAEAVRQTVAGWLTTAA